MVMQEGLRSEDLDSCFKKLMVYGGGGATLRGQMAPIWKDIPMELLLRILSFVDDKTVIRVSGVCCGWREAICLGLTRLCLSWCKNNMNDLVLTLAPKFTRLQTLILRQDKPQLEDSAVESIANFCHDVRELDLRKSFKLTDRSLHVLAHGCPNLTKLNISGCTAFNDSGIAYLTSFCKKLKSLNLCGCVRATTDRALQAIAYNCSELQTLNLGWCEKVGDLGVTSLANGCPNLRALDLCGCVLITDESVIALANRCPHLRSLGLYYCQNITDRAMYSLAQRVRNKHAVWQSIKTRYEYGGLMNLNISQCTALTPPAVQAVCDSFPSLHTCPGRHSLIISGCLNLTSVHCACGVHAHHAASTTTH
ncbi:hypothetical protein KSS87_005866 [Heliosperma pusillum]|nr:hypothetical protein KSS87_005866 [Heliosperma pusillum]